MRIGDKAWLVTWYEESPGFRDAGPETTVWRVTDIIRGGRTEVIVAEHRDERGRWVTERILDVDRENVFFTVDDAGRHADRMLTRPRLRRRIAA